MPKIRDLGINAIPLILQPPEIGGGGGGGGGKECTPERTTNGCKEKSCTPERTTNACKYDDDKCGPQQTSGRPGCTPKDDDYECKTSGKCPQKAAGFAPEVIAQLKQQLSSEITQQL